MPNLYHKMQEVMGHVSSVLNIGRSPTCFPFALGNHGSKPLRLNGPKHDLGSKLKLGFTRSKKLQRLGNSIHHHYLKVAVKEK